MLFGIAAIVGKLKGIRPAYGSINTLTDNTLPPPSSLEKINPTLPIEERDIVRLIVSVIFSREWVRGLLETPLKGGARFITITLFFKTLFRHCYC